MHCLASTRQSLQSIGVDLIAFLLRAILPSKDVSMLLDALSSGSIEQCFRGSLKKNEWDVRLTSGRKSLWFSIFGSEAELIFMFFQH
jgi:hypothetical protein